MATQIEIQDLADHTVTRARGKEAAARLIEILERGPVDLCLDGAEILSGPFLDEIVVTLMTHRATDRVTFVTSSDRTAAKLGRIAAIREATLYARSSTNAERSTIMPSRPTTAVVFSSEKIPQSHR